MAKKQTSQTEKVTEEKIAEEVIEETAADAVVAEESISTTVEAQPEPARNPIIIAKTSVPFRKVASLEQKYVDGQMPVGIAFQIVKEVHTQLYGDFYQLNNGKYVSKRGNYVIN